MLNQKHIFTWFLLWPLFPFNPDVLITHSGILKNPPDGLHSASSIKIFQLNNRHCTTQLKIQRTANVLLMQLTEANANVTCIYRNTAPKRYLRSGGLVRMYFWGVVGTSQTWLCSFLRNVPCRKACYTHRLVHLRWKQALWYLYTHILTLGFS